MDFSKIKILEGAQYYVQLSRYEWYIFKIEDGQPYYYFYDGRGSWIKWGITEEDALNWLARNDVKDIPLEAIMAQYLKEAEEKEAKENAKKERSKDSRRNSGDPAYREFIRRQQERAAMRAATRNHW